MRIQESVSRRFVRRLKVGLSVVLAGAVIWLGAGYLQGDTPADISQDTSFLSTDSSVEESVVSLPTVRIQAPARLVIDSIGVDAPIISVGTEPDGAMAAPKTATDIGWYERSAMLGTKRRAVLLSGHYGLDIPEVLRRLNELREGDSITIKGISGAIVSYKVVETERRHRTEVDMEKAFNYGEGEEAVSIITCIGEYDHAAGTYDDRYIVYAIRDS